MTELLSVCGLRTSFPRGDILLPVVDAVELVIHEGESVGLVGESGCGKSITALSIMRLVEPPGVVDSSSQILLRGRDLMKMSEQELVRVRGVEVSMVFQEPMTALNPVYTVGDQIEEGIRLHLGLSRRRAIDRAAELLELVGVGDPRRLLDSYPHQLSGGLRQRVVIAIALSCDPKLLIADEPTTALDVTIQAQILELLTKLRQQMGMSLLLITHDFGIVAEMCDRIAVMYAGRIVETGSKVPTLTHPKHPYTGALISCIPTLEQPAGEPLKVIPGTVPSPSSWPRGCRFAPRCDYVFDRCIDQDPPLMAAGEQLAACWLHAPSSKVQPDE